MKKKPFRLESVLRLRRTLRDECEVRAAEANRVASQAAEVAAVRVNAVRQATAVGGDARTFRASINSLELRAAAARAAAHAADEARAAHRARLDELVAASMAVTALERLEERANEEARLEAQRAEMREVDDLVTARFARNAAGARR